MRTIFGTAGLLSLTSLLACEALEGEKTVKFAVAMSTHGRDRLCTTEKGEKTLTDIDLFEDYKDNIKSISVVNIQAKITNDNTNGENQATTANGKAWLVSGPNATINVTTGDDGSVEPEDPTGDVVELGTYSDVPIKTGTFADIKFDKAGVEKVLNAAIKPPYKVQAVGRGCANAKPNFFAYEVFFTVKVKYSFL